MMGNFAQAILVYLMLVFGKVISERLDFKSGLVGIASFREGVTLELLCRQASVEDIKISSPTETIVQGSNLVHGMTDRYDYHNTSSASVLTIKRLRKVDQGIYTCEREETKKFAQVRVLYSPSNKSPQCTSNYVSPVIFDDIRQNYINFTCTTEEGNPPVLMTITVHESENFQNITDLEKLCIADQNSDSIKSFSCHMNKSLANTTFLCDVTQQFPSPYSESYGGSCSFGPLHFLSNLSVKVSKSYVTVKEGEDINLTCTSNVKGVEIKWIGIPVTWETHFATSDYFSHVSIKNVKQHRRTEITVKCIGAYGNREVTDSVKITIEGKTPAIVIVLLVILVIIGITISLGCYARKRGVSWSLRTKPDFDHNTPQNIEVNTFHMEATTSRPNKNNANNIAIKVCNGDKQGDSDHLNDQLDDTMVSDMHDNPVYESASIAAGATVSECNVDQYAVVSIQDNTVGI